MSRNLLNDRRFLERFDSEFGGKEKTTRPVKREMLDMQKPKQRDKTRRLPKEY